MAILTGVPRATVPARHAARRARLLLALAASGPLLGLLALGVAAGRGGSRPVRSTAGHDRAFAQIAALDVLAGRPTGLPRAAGLDADLGWQGRPLSARSVVWLSATEGAVAGEHYETDTFLVSATTGLYHLSVEVLDTGSGAVIGAAPSLTAAPTAPSGAPGLGYTALGRAEGTLPGGALRQIQTWARAYVDGDGATLYRLTGDTRAVTYPVLEGWVLEQVSVEGSAVRSGAALVQVRLLLHPVGQPTHTVTSDEDLLLGRLGQSLPFVQAWGPAGAGPQLVPYANAVP